MCLFDIKHNDSQQNMYLKGNVLCLNFFVLLCQQIKKNQATQKKKINKKLKYIYCITLHLDEVVD